MDWRVATVLGLFSQLGTVILSDSTPGASAILRAPAPAFRGVERAPQNASPTTPRPVAELVFSRLKPDAVLSIELEPGAVAAPDAIWLRQSKTSAIVRVDARSNALGKPVAVAKPPCSSLAHAFDTVWVPLCPDAIARVETKSGNMSASMPVPIASPEGTVAQAVGSVWVATGTKGVVSRLDPATNAAVAEVYVAPKPFAVAAQDDVVWVTSEDGNLLTRIDANTNLIVETVKVGPRPGRIAIGEGGVWTLNRGDGSVSRVDPKSNKVVATIAVGDAVSNGDIAAGEGWVWLSARGLPIVRIDPRSNHVAQRFTGDGGGAILVAHGSLWVNAGPGVTWRLDPKLVATLRP